MPTLEEMEERIRRFLLETQENPIPELLEHRFSYYGRVYQRLWVSSTPGEVVPLSTIPSTEDKMTIPTELLDFIAERTGVNRPELTADGPHIYHNYKPRLTLSSRHITVIGPFTEKVIRVIPKTGDDSGSLEHLKDMIRRVTPAVAPNRVKAVMNSLAWLSLATSSRNVLPDINDLSQYLYKPTAYVGVDDDGTLKGSTHRRLPESFYTGTIQPGPDGPLHFGHWSQLCIVRGDETLVMLRSQLPENASHLTTEDRNGIIVPEYCIPQPERAAKFLNYSAKVEQYVPEYMFKTGARDLYKKDIPFLGFELEGVSPTSQQLFAPKAHTIMDGHAISKSDGSLPQRGLEMVSVPATLDYWKEFKLTDKIEALRQEGFRSYNHSECGVHVHVSRNALSVLDLYKLERFIHNPLNKEFINFVAGRRENSYSKFTQTRHKSRSSLKTTAIQRPSSYDQRAYRAYVATAYRAAQVITPHQFRLWVRGWANHNTGYITVQQIFNLPESWHSAANAGWDAALHWNEFKTALERFPECQEQLRAPIRTVSKKAQYPSKRSESNWVKDDYTFSVGKTDIGRYDALNCQNGSTVEFRMFKGTVCGPRIMSYLEFVDACVRFVQQSGAAVDSYNDFLGWLSSPFNRHRYPNLCSYLCKSYAIGKVRNPIEFDQTNA